jgi:hypothetical protein
LRRAALSFLVLRCRFHGKFVWITGQGCGGH